MPFSPPTGGDSRSPDARGEEPSSELLRRIPQVDRLLASEEFAPLLAHHARLLLVEEIRADLESLRRRAANGGLEAQDIELHAIRERVAQGLARRSIPFYRRVINATGVILHTGLGRAPLAAEAVRAVAEAAPHPLRVEIDLDTGKRGGREEGCARILRALTGGAAATMVNNNAGATLLILAALARGKKVLLSRGEMVEIGGSYRVPEIMAESGATLVEVGTTNRTHPHDYRRAVDEETGMILKVHTSNYRVEGFTSEVEIEELVDIGREHGIPVVHDLGSGCLFDLERHGLPGEPLVQRSVVAGTNLVCFSGDKLLGGPQAGLIVGAERDVERCRQHPLYRALRCDRLTYVALEATLRIYEEGEDEACRRIPVLRRLLGDPGPLRGRARKLARKLAREGLAAEVVQDQSQAGSGSLPARNFPTWSVRLVAEKMGSEELGARLRAGHPAVLGKIRDDSLLLDLRTIDDDEFPLIARRIDEILGAGTS